jgi:hypothetical protein
MSNFKVENSTYKGHNILTIKDSNDKIVISFGKKKANAIIECFEKIKEFAESSDKKIDISSLSKEQIDSILGLLSN